MPFKPYVRFHILAICTFSYFSSVQVTEWPPIGE